MSGRKQKIRLQALMMATVDFHLAQCYFAAAIQIAALVFWARDYLLIRWIVSPELLDARLLMALATNGFAPTMVTLALISQYGRQSWYLISLSSINFVLSTVMLAASSSARYVTPFDASYGGLSACGDFLASNLTTTWCGSNSLFTDSGHNHVIISAIVWVMWTHSLLWLVYCVLKKVRTLGRTRLGFLCMLRIIMSNRIPMRRSWGPWSERLFVITWSLSFGYQLFQLYAVILRGAITNYTWSFGQILAVVLWAPCLAGFINLTISESLWLLSGGHVANDVTDGVFKGSEYRFPPPLTLATIDGFGTLYRDDSTSQNIALEDMSNRRVNTDNDGGSDTVRGVEDAAENI